MAAQDISAMPNPDRANITEHPAGEEIEVIALVLIKQLFIFLGCTMKIYNSYYNSLFYPFTFPAQGTRCRPPSAGLQVPSGGNWSRWGDICLWIKTETFQCRFLISWRKRERSAKLEDFGESISISIISNNNSYNTTISISNTWIRINTIRLTIGFSDWLRSDQSP